MFVDTLGSGEKDVLTTLVNGKPSSSLITALHPDEWMCIHSPPNAKSINDAHTAPVYAQSLRLSEQNNQKVVLLVNTRNSSANVTIVGAAGGTIRAVDLRAGHASSPYSEAKLSSSSYILGGWGVALLILPKD